MTGVQLGSHVSHSALRTPPSTGRRDPRGGFWPTHYRDPWSFGGDVTGCPLEQGTPTHLLPLFLLVLELTASHVVSSEHRQIVLPFVQQHILQFQFNLFAFAGHQLRQLGDVVCNTVVGGNTVYTRVCMQLYMYTQVCVCTTLPPLPTSIELLRLPVHSLPLYNLRVTLRRAFWKVMVTCAQWFARQKDDA